MKTARFKCYVFCDFVYIMFWDWQDYNITNQISIWDAGGWPDKKGYKGTFGGDEISTY